VGAVAASVGHKARDGLLQVQDCCVFVFVVLCVVFSERD
jgi:hypothetical protein